MSLQLTRVCCVIFYINAFVYVYVYVFCIVQYLINWSSFFLRDVITFLYDSLGTVSFYLGNVFITVIIFILLDTDKLCLLFFVR